jgi:hypothetical protein
VGRSGDPSVTVKPSPVPIPIPPAGALLLHASSEGAASSTERVGSGDTSGRPGRGRLAIAASIGVTAVGTFRSWGLDRGRLIYSLVQQARSPQAHRVPLALGFGVGLPLVGFGLTTMGRSYKEQGITGMFGDGQALLGAASTVSGAGAVAAGMHRGLPSQLALMKDFFRGPTTQSIPVTGRGWGAINKLSNGISSSMALLTLAASAANIQDGIHRNGMSGLYDHKSGRTGMIYGTGALVGLGFNLRSGIAHARPGESFMSAALGSEWLASSKIRNIRYGIGIATGALWLTNEVGGFNWLNSR